MNYAKSSLGLIVGAAITAQLLVVGCNSSSDDNKVHADMVLTSGSVYTMNDANDVVTSVAVKDGEIIYVGNDEGLDKFIGTGTEVINLDGDMLVPGFVDGHGHPPMQEVNSIILLQLELLEPSVEVYQQALKEYRSKNPEKEAIWATGMVLKAFENGEPHKNILDEIVSDIPVLFYDTSYHGLLLNSRALELSNITSATPDPEGGTIYRDGSGEPTGYLSDAGHLVSADIHFPVVTIEAFKKGLEEYQEDSARKGITATHALFKQPIFDQTGNDVPPWVLAGEYAASGQLTMRYGWQIQGNDVENSAEMTIKRLDEGQKYSSDWQNLRTVKTFLDGVPEGKTSYLLEPYAPGAGTDPDYRGNPRWNVDNYLNYFTKLDKAGYQIHTHVMGDASSRLMIDAVELAYGENGQRDGRHAMVHANLIDPIDIPRMGQLGMYAAMQPIWFYADPTFAELEQKMLGKERFDQEYSVKDMVDEGVVITGSSDYPATLDNRPLFGIETGVTQGSPYPGQQGNDEYVRDVDQRLSVIEMLRIYTINGAKQMFMEDIIGSIEVGKKADFVVLGEDITQIDPVDISETEIVATIVDGNIVYSNY